MLHRIPQVLKSGRWFEVKGDVTISTHHRVVVLNFRSITKLGNRVCIILHEHFIKKFSKSRHEKLILLSSANWSLLAKDTDRPQAEVLTKKSPCINFHTQNWDRNINTGTVSSKRKK